MAQEPKAQLTAEASSPDTAAEAAATAVAPASGPADATQAEPRPRKLVRAPLAAVALAVILGSVGGMHLPMAWGFWALVGGLALLAGAALMLRAHTRLAAVAMFIVAIGCASAVHTRLAYYHVPDDHILTFMPGGPQLATIRGRAVSFPLIVRDAPAAGYQGPDRTVLLVEATAIQGREGWFAAQGLVRVTVDEPAVSLKAGQELELVGTLSRVSGPRNPGQYDRRKAARLSGTLAQMRVASTQGAAVLSGPQGAASALWWRLRASARAHLLGVGEGNQGRMLGALVIGERDPALSKLNDSMRRLGIAHFMSISGMHLGVLLGLVYALCRLATLRPRRAALAVLATLGLYLLVAQPYAPLLRSAIMAACLCLGVLLGRRYSPLNSLAVALVILLAIEPLSLFSAGFQLSFGIVAGLILLSGPIRQMLFGRFIRRRGLMVFRGRSRASRWLWFTAANWAMSLVVYGLAAYIIAAPLAAWHFGIFSPYAMPLSMLLGPLVAAVLVPAYVSAALAWPMPNISAAVGSAAGWLAGLLEGVVELLARLPWCGVSIRPVSFWWVAVVILAAVALVNSRRWKLGRWIAGWAVVTIVGATAWTQRTASPPPHAQLHVLSVGAGQCILLRTPSGQCVLLDAGTRSGFDAYSQCLGPLLLEFRLPPPRSVFISHANTDHYNALFEPIKARSIRKLYVSPLFAQPLPREPEPAPSSLELLVLATARGTAIDRVSAGRVIEIDQRTSIEVVWPRDGPPPPGMDANESSLVLRVVCDGGRVLVPGDIEALAQEALAAQPELIQCDVLVLPHHGGWRPTLPAFVEACGARVVIQSDASEIRGDWPDATRRDFYRGLKTARRFYSTARDGWTCVELSGPNPTVKTLR